MKRKTLERLEPNLANADGGFDETRVVMASIAISLKRIADMMEEHELLVKGVITPSDARG